MNVPARASVLFDLSVLRTEARVRGIGRYVSDLALGMSRAAGARGLSLLGMERIHWSGRAEVHGDLRESLARLALLPEENHLAWAYRLRVGLARAARALAPDLVHTGHPNATPLGRFACPRVTTCHDLIPLRYPAHYLDWRDGYYAGRRRLDHRRYHSADHVIAVSESTASDLVTLLGVPARHISVVHNGVDLTRWTSDALPGDDGVRRAHGLASTPYLLYVGAPDWRKNADGMFRALASLRQQGKLGDLVLAWAAKLDAAASARLTAQLTELGIAGAVRFLGYVPDAALAALYRGAIAQLFVSRSEGFGYPVVEAMASGCPVITSGCSSTAEIARDAAWLVDPEAPAEIADAIHGLSSSESERQRFRRLGAVRAQQFSLERMADGTLDVYQGLIGR